ncbi:MAG: helix-turn-helix domain-containing protein [Neobacillus sp.]
MQYIENVMLYCLKQLNGERTIYSIYHLLNGKKSSQTLQDAHLFLLKKYFRILESLTREEFDKVMSRLIEKHYVEAIGDQKFVLSSLGEEVLQTTVPIEHLNGWKYHHLTSIVWERLSLLVQVTSNLTYHEAQYIPIQKSSDVHNWLKKLLKKQLIRRNEMGKALLTELVVCLEGAKDINPSVLVFRLTGYQQIGLTSIQTAQLLKMDVIDYQLEFTSIIHYIIHRLEKDFTRFTLLSMLLYDIEENDILTLSARKTWRLLSQGFSLQQIGEIRKLKMSTIEDHLVEFALNVENFSIDTYVEKEMQQKILEISRRESSRQLKVIRKYIEEASYFQIRLVMAKHGER